MPIEGKIFYVSYAMNMIQTNKSYAVVLCSVVQKRAVLYNAEIWHQTSPLPI